MKTVEIYTDNNKFLVRKTADDNWELREYTIIDIGLHQLEQIINFNNFREVKFYLNQNYPELLEVE